MAVNGGNGEDPIDFFISYTQADSSWAKWIAWVLEEERYTVVLQAWDFVGVGDFVKEIARSIRRARRFLAVLSRAYFESTHATTESDLFIAKEGGSTDHVLTVRVDDVTPDGYLSVASYTDLFGPDEKDARDRLVTAVKGRAKPATPPAFPPDQVRAVPERPAFPSDLPPVWNMTHNPNPIFTGRDSLIADVHRALQARDGGVVALVGSPAVGKTAVAAEYVYRHTNEYSDGVWWINGADSSSVREGLAQLGDVVDPRPGPDRAQDAAVLAAQRWLEGHRHWLLCIDNGRDPEATLWWLPTRHRQVLITSQRWVWDQTALTLRVDPLDIDNAEALLRTAMGLRGQSAHHGEAEREAIRELARQVDRLPLFVLQVGTTIRDGLIGSATSYLKELKTAGSDASGSSVKTHSFDLAFDDLRSKPAARALVCVLAFLDPTDIPIELFRLARDVLPSSLAAKASSLLELNSVFAELSSRSLLTSSGTADGVAMHQVFQNDVRARLSPKEYRRYASVALSLVANAFPEEGNLEKNWRASARLLPHVKRTADRGIEPEASILVLQRAGKYLQHRGDFQGATDVLGSALRIAERSHGQESLAAADVLEPLGFVYRDLRQSDKARQALERALSIRLAELGEESVKVASVRSKLGFVLWDKFERPTTEAAKGLFEDALRVYESASPGSWDAAATLTGLGQVERDLGHIERAIECQTQALRYFEALPDNELDVARTLDKLGYVQGDAGRPSEAEALHRRALDMFTALYGEDPHPEKAWPLTNRGVAAADQGDLERARAYQTQALEILKIFLGPTHPSTEMVQGRLDDLDRKPKGPFRVYLPE